MRNTRRRVGWAVVLAAFAVVVLCYANNWVFRYPIASTCPGADIAEIGGIPFYSQLDARWDAHRLGVSPDDLATSGCTLCCLAMALAPAGIAQTPDALNRELRASQALTGDGLIIWKAMPWVRAGTLRFTIPALNQRTIRDLLARKVPIIAKVRLTGDYTHWVLIVGVLAGDYVVLDPLDETRKAKPLSAISRQIHDLRAVERL